MEKVMPNNKHQERRLRILTAMLLANDSTPVRYGTFLEKMRDLEIDDGYKISSKTFSRDIATLRDDFHAPLKYDTHRQSWRLTDSSWKPDAFWGKFDARKAILSERIASSLMPKKMQAQLQDALGGLLTNSKGHACKYMELESFQMLSPCNYFVNGNIFLEVYQAWEKRERIELSYCDRKGISKIKVFEPHILAWYNNTWYIKGKLLENRTSLAVAIKDPPEVQVLALHRISHVRPLKKFFKTDSQLLQQVQKTGLFDFKKIPVVEMEFFGMAARTMAERFELRPGIIVSKTDDLLKVKLENIAEHEALSLAMNAHGEVRITSPESLRKSLRELAQKLVDHHS